MEIRKIRIFCFILLFRFAFAHDRYRILATGPRHYGKALLVFSPIVGTGALEEQNFNKAAL